MDERERCERNRVPDDSATPGESATIHYVLKTVLTGIRGKRSICTVCSWRQEGCNLIPIRFDGNQIDEANGTRTAAGIEELHPGVSGNGGR